MASSRLRALVTAIFALLLLGMQHEVQVHALQHLGSILHPAHEQGIQQPTVDTSCLECSLLASGSPGAATEIPGLPATGVGTSRIVSIVESRSLAAPSYYSSRAPPSLL